MTGNESERNEGSKHIWYVQYPSSNSQPGLQANQEIVMIFFKSCPRCEGDIIYDEDYFGAYKSCLACGYVYYAENESISQNKSNPSDKTYDSTILLESLNYTMIYL